MSWISNLFSPRKRQASEKEGDDGFLGSVFKKLKQETPIEVDENLKPEETISYNVDTETSLASLVSSVLTPRPLTLVAWKNKDGDLSVVPTSFCSVVSESPAYISIGLPEESVPEDTHAAEVGRSKEFTVGIVSEWISSQALNTLGTYELPDEEADLKTGLTTTASEQVAVPRISETAASLECKLHHKVAIKNSEGDVVSIVVIAKVLCVHINKSILTKSADGEPMADVSKLRPVGALGNDLGATVGQAFPLAKPLSPPVSPRSPGVNESAPPISPAVAERAEVVAQAVVDALTEETVVPESGHLGDARLELAETVLDAVENALELEENGGDVVAKGV